MQRFLTYINQSLYPIFTQNEIRLYARILLEKLAGISNVQILTDKDRELSAETFQNLCSAVDRLAHHEPVEYIVGETEFCGHLFTVGKGVLIPRPETEELVAQLIQTLKSGSQYGHPDILDIGTGSGCIAVSLAAALPDATVRAWDISQDALNIAKENSVKTGVEVLFSLMDALSENAFDAFTSELDVVVSNPPYVCQSESAEMEQHVLNYEPHTALFVDDNDPLIFYRSIARIAYKALRKGGLLCFEINRKLGVETQNIVLQAGFEKATLARDLSGNDRFIYAER